MEPETLNRIGIILNFLAGFLLAPELLGTERLKRIEDFLERLAPRIADSGIHIISKTSQFFRDFYFPFKAPFSDTLFQDRSRLASLVHMFFVFVAVAVGIAYVVNILTTEPNAPLAKTTFLVFVYGITTIITLLFGIPILVIITVVVVGVIVLLATLLFSTLVGESKLRSVIVLLGIISFIVGSILQFIATF